MNDHLKAQDHEPYRDLLSLGARGDGVSEDGTILQSYLDSGGRYVYLPAGCYRVDRTLRLPSGTHIQAHPCARVFLSGRIKPMAGDFLLTNQAAEPGGSGWDRDISIRGGIWDGGFGQGYNDKTGDILDMTQASGACMNFVRVSGLTLSHMVIANSVTYYLRLGEVTDFSITDLSLVSDRVAYNQDGIHFGGGCQRGVVDGLRALSRGQTNDDLLAFNADDSTVRVENGGLVCAPIQDIHVRNVYAEDCYTAIRLLSVTSAIRRVTVEHVTAGVRVYALNMDGARYCRTPLFRDADRPGGVGELDGVVIRDFSFWATRPDGHTPLIHAETLPGAGGLTVALRRLTAKETANDRPLLQAGKIPGSRLILCRPGRPEESVRLATSADGYTTRDSDICEVRLEREAHREKETETVIETEKGSGFITP